MTLNNNLESDYYWFKRHLINLTKIYNDKWVVVRNKEIIGTYDSFTEAYDDMVFVKNEQLGTFIIQMCSLDERKTSIKVYTPFHVEEEDASP